MLGYKLPFRPNYGDETTTDGRGKSNYIGTSSNRTPFQYVEDNLPLIKKTYYGGRNEQLFYGVTPIDEYFDYDLVSAYPSAMMTIGLIDWDHHEQQTRHDIYFRSHTDFRPKESHHRFL